MAVQFTSKQFLKEMKKIKKKSLAMDNSTKNPMKAKYDIQNKIENDCSIHDRKM